MRSQPGQNEIEWFPLFYSPPTPRQLPCQLDKGRLPPIAKIAEDLKKAGIDQVSFDPTDWILTFFRSQSERNHWSSLGGRRFIESSAGKTPELAT